MGVTEGGPKVRVAQEGPDGIEAFGAPVGGQARRGRVAELVRRPALDAGRLAGPDNRPAVGRHGVGSARRSARPPGSRLPAAAASAARRLPRFDEGPPAVGLGLGRLKQGGVRLGRPKPRREDLPRERSQGDGPRAAEAAPLVPGGPIQPGVAPADRDAAGGE